MSNEELIQQAEEMIKLADEPDTSEFISMYFITRSIALTNLIIARSKL